VKEPEPPDAALTGVNGDVMTAGVTHGRRSTVCGSIDRDTVVVPVRNCPQRHGEGRLILAVPVQRGEVPGDAGLRV
jgi:hypothetical protein